MGREARASKPRLCAYCVRATFSSAEELKGHADTCRRMKDLGLLTPGVDTLGVTPENKKPSYLKIG